MITEDCRFFSCLRDGVDHAPYPDSFTKGNSPVALSHGVGMVAMIWWPWYGGHGMGAMVWEPWYGSEKDDIREGGGLCIFTIAIRHWITVDIDTLILIKGKPTPGDHFYGSGENFPITLPFESFLIFLDNFHETFSVPGQ